MASEGNNPLWRAQALLQEGRSKLRATLAANPNLPLQLVGFVVAAVAVLFALSYFSRSSSAVQPQPAAPSSETAIELTPGQLSAVKIATASAYPFAVDKEAVGNISYNDDPNVIQAESALLAAAAQFELTRKELARVKSLGTSNGIAQKDLEQATSDEETAEAAFKAARDAVRALGKTDAEIDRMVSSGRIESAEHRAFKWAIVNVPESDSPMLHPGEPAEFRVMALPGKTFEGVVSEVYSSVDPNAHRVTVRAQIADPNDQLLPGMLADVSIEVEKLQPSIGIPETGVVREGDGTMTVWVTADKHRFVQKVVKTGIRENGRVQILQGLGAGQLVVTDGAIYLDTMVQAPSGDDD